MGLPRVLALALPLCLAALPPVGNATALIGGDLSDCDRKIGTARLQCTEAISEQALEDLGLRYARAMDQAAGDGRRGLRNREQQWRDRTTSFCASDALDEVQYLAEEDQEVLGRIVFSECMIDAVSKERESLLSTVSTVSAASPPGYQGGRAALRLSDRPAADCPVPGRG